MADSRSEAVRRRLDDLSSDVVGEPPRIGSDGATAFFRDLFVRELGFDAVTSRRGGGPRELPVEGWGDEAGVTAASLVAASGEFRVVYAELESLTRRAQRTAVGNLVRSDRASDWAVDGTFVVVFHELGEAVWHLATPYDPTTDDVATGRPTLRRFVIGAGQTHRTAGNALARLRTGDGVLADRVDEAFGVESVTEEFHADYEAVLGDLRDELVDAGLEAGPAERYAHITLCRLLALYYLQAAARLGDRRDFVRWFLERYEQSGDDGEFHETWLSALFFGGIVGRDDGDSLAALPEDVRAAVANLSSASVGLFRPTDVDETDAYVSDGALATVVREFLERYNFTVAEETPSDADVAVDPSMLGKLYESLVAGRDRGDAGIFYTPRAEVDFMCRTALYEQLSDGLDDTDDEERRRLVEFVFGDPRNWEPEGDEPERIEAVLRGLRIVDPACGSGAFLVGTTRVLAELYGKLGRSAERGLRGRIVEENVHGVDVKRWAVRVAEFRLWLLLLRDEEHRPTGHDSLLDVQFDLRSGDSLLQRKDDDPGFRWERAFPDVMDDGGFDVAIGNPPYVRQENIDCQGDAGAAADETSESAYKSALAAFARRRFDVEPYGTSDLYLYFFLRGVDVLRPGGTLCFVTSNSWLDVDYGAKLQEFLLTEGALGYVFESRAERTFDAGVNTAITVVDRRSPGRLSGRTEFVSTAGGYDRVAPTDGLESILVGDDAAGTTLSFRGETATVRSERGWRSVGLSAPALWRLGGGRTSATGAAAVETDGDGGADAIGIDAGGDADGDDPVETDADGGETDGVPAESAIPVGSYRSGKWGKYTRAPTVFFELVAGAEPDLVPLGSVCDVRRGTRTGANQFFYLPSKYYDADPDGDALVLRSTGEWPDDEYATELELPRECWMHRTEEGWEPNFVLKSSKSFDEAVFDPESLEVGRGLRYALAIDRPRADLDGALAEYVRWGEQYDPGRDDLCRTTSAFSASASNRGVGWYDLTEDLRRGDVLPMKNVDARHVYWLPERRIWIDDRLHGIEVPGGDPDRRFLAGVLNSTYGTLSCEVNGRVNLGQGALDLSAADHGRTLVPPLDAVDDDLKADVAGRFADVGARSAASLFEELGATDPEGVSFETVADDRLALDRLVVCDLFGFDESTLRRLYEGTLALVRQRIDKADGA